MGFGVSGPKEKKDVIIAETDDGKSLPVGPARYQVTGRGGKGHTMKRKAKVVRVSLPEPPPPASLLN